MADMSLEREVGLTIKDSEGADISATVDVLNSIAAGIGSPKMVIIVGKNGCILKSTNLYNYVKQDVDISEDLIRVTYSDYYFTAVGDEGGIYCSADGSTWGESVPPPPGGGGD